MPHEIVSFLKFKICPFFRRKFPMDTQNCFLRIGSCKLNYKLTLMSFQWATPHRRLSTCGRRVPIRSRCITDLLFRRAMIQDHSRKCLSSTWIPFWRSGLSLQRFAFHLLTHQRRIKFQWHGRVRLSNGQERVARACSVPFDSTTRLLCALL